MMAEAATDWIEWAGGECPVSPDTLVVIKTADGDPSWESEVRSVPAAVFVEPPCNWWTGENCHEWRIIAYRVVSA